MSTNDIQAVGDLLLLARHEVARLLQDLTAEQRERFTSGNSEHSEFDADERQRGLLDLLVLLATATKSVEQVRRNSLAKAS